MQYKEFTNGFQPPDVMTFDKEKEITADVIQEFIKKHQEEVPRYHYLMDMYKGKMEILQYDAKESYKPDNRLIVNFAKYITDTFTGYFNGVPVKKSHEDDECLEKMTDFDHYNGIEDEEAELAKLACVYGRAYEFMYQDEDTQTNVVHNGPENMFMVYDTTVKKEPLFVVRYGIDEDDKLVGELYTLDWACELTGSADEVEFGEELPRYYDELPVTEWILNEERLSLFESTIALMNAYNKALSEKANDVEYFSDQYLAFLGAEVDPEDLKTIRENRIINYFGDDGANKVDVKFLDKPDSDEQTEHLLDRIEKLIFQTSMIANISDENFGQSSGTALAYKLQAMSNLALSFQRKFQGALSRRYRLFFSLGTNMPATKQDAWKDIQYTFTRNEPKDIKEQAETAQMLLGVTSEKTALKGLSVVDDVDEEIKQIKKESTTEQQRQGRELNGEEE